MFPYTHFFPLKISHVRDFEICMLIINLQLIQYEVALTEWYLISKKKKKMEKNLMTE